MKLWIKLGFALGFAVTAAVFGVLFYQSYDQVTRARSAGTTSAEDVVIPGEAAAADAATERASEQTPDKGSDKTADRAPETTPDPATAPTPAKRPGKGKNRAATNMLASGSAPSADNPTPKGAGGTPKAAARKSHLAVYGASFLGSVILLGLLVGREVSHYLAHRTVKVLYDEDGAGLADQDYEQAEQQWADGNHLEAIRRMRDYLNRNPREQHVALRIAEIYEKDLKNHLAAALEYEEVLQQKLSPERWGWAAIHLCNLYSRLNQSDKAISLLRRIDAEYGQTKAAEKARQRLAMLEARAPAGPGAVAADPAEEQEPPPPA